MRCGKLLLAVSWMPGEHMEMRFVFSFPGSMNKLGRDLNSAQPKGSQQLKCHYSSCLGLVLQPSHHEGTCL